MMRYDGAMNQILDHVLGAARQLGASDVHLKSGLPPVFRIKGDLRTLRDTPPLTADVIGTFAVNLMNDQQRAHFDKHHDADLSYGTPDGVRYRVNVFKQRSSLHDGSVELTKAYHDREPLVKQSKDLQEKLQALVLDLLLLSKTDDEAKQIVTKYNIQQQGTEAAPAPAPADAPK